MIMSCGYRPRLGCSEAQAVRPCSSQRISFHSSNGAGDASRIFLNRKRKAGPAEMVTQHRP